MTLKRKTGVYQADLVGLFGLETALVPWENMEN
jgi:hypothetical protein